MTDNPNGFWSSLSGILTGLAAVITAATGLFIAIKDDNPSPPPNTGHPPAISQGPAIAEGASKPAENPLDPGIVVEPVTSHRPKPVKRSGHQGAESIAGEVRPFPNTGPLVDCTQFPTVNTLSSLMNWSDYYHKQIPVAEGVTRRAWDPCSKAIDYRGMAHCKAPEDPEIRMAFLETLTLCRKAGIEWTEIEHTTILGNAN